MTTFADGMGHAMEMIGKAVAVPTEPGTFTADDGRQIRNEADKVSGHRALIRYVPANMITSAGYAWFCSCGERSEWFLVDPELRGESQADKEACIAVTLDSRRHRAQPWALSPS